MTPLDTMLNTHVADSFEPVLTWIELPEPWASKADYIEAAHDADDVAMLVDYYPVNTPV